MLRGWRGTRTRDLLGRKREYLGMQGIAEGPRNSVSHPEASRKQGALVTDSPVEWRTWRLHPQTRSTAPFPRGREAQKEEASGPRSHFQPWGPGCQPGSFDALLLSLSHVACKPDPLSETPP